jgi:alpha-ketoglutarate-dependent taurine dioxygenase
MIPTSINHISHPASGGPFTLSDTDAYATWRRQKLARVPRRAQDLIVDIRDPRALSSTECEALLRRCRSGNLAIYQCDTPLDKPAVRRLGEQLGLTHLDDNLCADHDSISSLEVRAGGMHAGYIPYTDRNLNWHTDGYYNSSHQQIRAFILHCVRNASRGGINQLLDPELAYILIRDENPNYIRALAHPQAMTIPANRSDGAMRGAQSGPVFSVEQATGSLHMRYTARTRSIQWRDDPVTRDAVGFLVEILSRQTPYVIQHRLQPGQGLVCNNVLHNRSAFSNAMADERLLYRARYYDRIKETDTYRFLSETDHALA